MTTAFRAGAPPATTNQRLGPLADLPGTWVGSGFNLVALPKSPPPAPKHNPSFFVKLNATREVLNFTAITAPIPDRGFEQADIEYLGLHYLQQVSDAVTNAGLHIETGMWLNVPATTAPPQAATVVRLATVPHGDSLLLQGLVEPPAPTGPLPFPTLNSAPTGQIFGTGYSENYHLPLPPGLPPNVGPALEVISNPNMVLTAAIKGQNIVRTVTLAITTTGAGGILNMPFVVTNANATQCSATFWIETVRHNDGREFLQLQYSQTVNLFFGGINWPHISVGTLVKQ
jgi:hypothetical protein